MILKKIYIVLIFLAYSIVLNATNYYIDSTNGNDSNTGLSPTMAFKSLYKIDGLDLLPGDTVHFMQGTYTKPNSTLITITKSGAENAYITFQNYKDDNVILEFDSWTGIDIINGASYIKIKGLKIKGARSKINLDDALKQPGSCVNDLKGDADGLYNGTGILAVGPNLSWSNSATTGNEIPHHITVENCEVYDCSSSGLAFQQADYVTVINNKIYNNCWYSLFGTSGVNLYQFINTDGTENFHNKISNNLLFGNEMKVPQVPFCKFYDGNALIVDDFNHTQIKNYLDKSISFDPYSAKTLISNNISANNGGSGLHFFLSDNCYIYNNTVVNNAFQNDGINGNANLRIAVCKNFDIRNNIFVNEKKMHMISSNANINYTNNFQYGANILSKYIGCENCIENVELEFISTDLNDPRPFITAFNSSVKNAGIALSDVTTDFLNTPRPQDNAPDVGAYELLECYPTLWYADKDNDGLGDPSDTLYACDQPLNYVTVKGDQCPNDPDKIVEGLCGCGTDENSCDTICNAPAYDTAAQYATEGTVVTYMGRAYENKWYTNGDLPTNGGPWKLIRICNGTEIDCSTLIQWSSSTIYGTPNTRIVYENNVYENKWYVTSQTPSTSDAWELIGKCDSSESSEAKTTTKNNVIILSSLPNSDFFSLETNKDYTLNIFNLSGNLISKHLIYSGSTTIDTNQLKKGIHILTFTNSNSNKIITKRIVKY